MAYLKVDRSAKTLRELTLEKLRGAIVRGYFRSGARLVGKRLAAAVVDCGKDSHQSSAHHF